MKLSALIMRKEAIDIATLIDRSELALFYTDEQASIFEGDMYSGNKA